LVQIAGERALLLGDADPSSFPGFELYSVPLDGSLPPVRLHGDLPTGGAVSAVHGVLADGAVLFMAALETAGVDGLYRSPIDGRAAPVRLNDELSPGETIEDVRFTPGGSRVAFLHQGFVLSVEKNQLFSAPTLGGQNVSLSPVPTSGTPIVDVLTTYQVSAGGRAVFLAAEDPSVQTNLLSAPVDGSGHSTQLSPGYRRWKHSSSAGRCLGRLLGRQQARSSPIDERETAPPRRDSVPSGFLQCASW
jgi:hypothetical protein